MAAKVNYTAADYKLLKEAERKIHDTLPLIDKLEACGGACDEYRGIAQQVLTTLGNLEREFMTPPPR